MGTGNEISVLILVFKYKLRDGGIMIWESSYFLILNEIVKVTFYIIYS